MTCDEEETAVLEDEASDDEAVTLDAGTLEDDITPDDEAAEEGALTVEDTRPDEGVLLDEGALLDSVKLEDDAASDIMEEISLESIDSVDDSADDDDCTSTEVATDEEGMTAAGVSLTTGVQAARIATSISDTAHAINRLSILSLPQITARRASYEKSI